MIRGRVHVDSSFQGADDGLNGRVAISQGGWFSWQDGLAACVLLSLVVLTLSYLTTQLTYDEAVYLSVAREISESGLPLRRDLTGSRLFQNNPPLVMYVASLSQYWFPGEQIPSRLVHVLVFVVPTYLLVWFVTRQRFGRLAGLASLLSLLGSGEYVGGTQQVQLDVPLGLLAVATLLLFERACTSRTASVAWGLAAAVGLAASALTKYQAFCVCVAVATYCGYVARRDGRTGLRRLAAPLCLQVVAGAAVIGILVAFYFAFGGVSTLVATWSFNAGRMSVGSLGTVEVARRVLATATESATALGPVLVMASCLAMLVQSRHRDLLVLLTAYVLASLAFNVVFFNLPGSGSYYLLSVVPAMAILAGASAGSLESNSTSHRNSILAAAASVQFVSAPPPMYLPPHVNAPLLAARFIASQGLPDVGVLATTMAIQFYDGNPVGIITFSGEDEVLDALAGRGPTKVGFVVIERGAPPAGVENYYDQWKRLLSEHFVVASVDNPGLLIYQRRPVPIDGLR